MAKLTIIFLVIYTACTLEKTVGLNFFYQANPVYEDIQTYPYLPSYAAIWKPDCDNEEESGESSESSSSESSESSESGESSESKESSKSSKESSGESKSKESKESGESNKSSESSSSEEKEGSSKEEEEGESKSSEGSSEGSEEKKKETPKKKKKKERKPLFPPPSYPFPTRQLQRIIYSPASSYAYLPMPYRPASSYVVQQPVSSYPVKSSIQYMTVPASQTYARYSPPIVGNAIPGQKIVYSAGSPLTYPQVSKTIISPGARAYPVAGSWSSPISYLKK